jgi:hypothetical protein
VCACACDSRVAGGSDSPLPQTAACRPWRESPGDTKPWPTLGLFPLSRPLSTRPCHPVTQLRVSSTRRQPLTQSQHSDRTPSHRQPRQASRCPRARPSVVRLPCTLTLAAPLVITLEPTNLCGGTARASPSGMRKRVGHAVQKQLTIVGVG